MRGLCLDHAMAQPQAFPTFVVLLQEDRGSQGLMDPQEYGRERLAFVADTWKAKGLDPAQFLTPGRHYQWTEASGDQALLPMPTLRCPLSWAGLTAGMHG